MSMWDARRGQGAAPESVTEPATPRPRRRVISDVRLLMGAVLVVASISGVWAVVALGRQTHPVYAAAHTLVAGDDVTLDDLDVVDVSLGGAASSYLSPDDDGLGDIVATRTIDVGELLPAAATGRAADVDRTTVVVQTSMPVPADVQAASRVEVWAAAQTERGRFDSPTILVSDATVASVDTDDSMMGGGGVSLELVIPRDAVADALDAISSESALSVVPAGAPR